MKKMYHILVLGLMSLGILASCDGNGKSAAIEAERDSIMRENSKLNEFLNLVATSMDSINGREKVLFINSEGHQINSKEQIRDNIKLFQNTLDEQRKRIAELESQLGREDDARSRKLRSIINNLQLQIKQKEEMIAQLEQELENKNVDIANLQSHVERLNDDVTSLTKTNNEQEENLKEAANEITNLSVAYIIMGTKKQLSAAGVLKGNFLAKKKVDLSSVDNSMFTKVDTRQCESIDIPGKNVTLMTQHPQASYAIQENGNASVLEIINSSQFWSTSHYLIIQYK